MLGAKLKLAAAGAVGEKYWYGRFGSGAGDQRRPSIATDSAGNAYIAGLAETITEIPYSASSLFVAKLNKRGELLWQRKLTSSAGFQDCFARKIIDTDDSGNVYVCGGTVDDYGVLVKYNTNGILQWQKQFQSQETAGTGHIFTGVAVTNSNVYVCGQSKATLSAGMVKYDVNGNVQWSSLLQNSFSRPYEAAVDSNGTPYMVSPLPSPGGLNGLGTVRFNTISGAVSWQRNMYDRTGSVAFTGTAITTDNNDGVIGVYSTGYSSNGDTFVSKYTSGGTTQWQHRIPFDPFPTGIAVSSPGNIWISGRRSNTNEVSLVALEQSNGSLQISKALWPYTNLSVSQLAIANKSILVVAEEDDQGDDNAYIAKLPDSASFSLITGGIRYIDRSTVVYAMTYDIDSASASLASHTALASNATLSEGSASLAFSTTTI